MAQAVMNNYNRNYMPALIFTLCFVGYPFLASLSSLFSYSNTSYSIYLRSFTIAACILYMLHYRPPSRGIDAASLAVLVVFWTIYLFRMAYDTTSPASNLSFDWSYYWIWAVGGCLIPAIALATRRLTIRQAPSIFPWVFVGTFAGAVFASLAGSGAVIDQAGFSLETGRLRLEALNPISLGHLGATLIVFSVWSVIYVIWNRPWMRIVPFSGLIIGGYILLASNSRGPLISTGACLIFILFMSNFRFKIRIAALCLVLAISFVPAARFVQDNFGVTTFSRMVDMSIMEDASSSIRLELYLNAIDGFMNNMWTGAGIEEPITRSYPHNVVIESFMSLGLCGGLMFVSLLTLVSLKAVFTFRMAPQSGWLSLLFLQHLVGAMFSGALYNVVYLWPAVGALISLELPMARSRQGT